MKNVISRRSFLKAAGIIGASAALAACGGSSASTAGKHGWLHRWRCSFRRFRYLHPVLGR